MAKIGVLIGNNLIYIEVDEGTGCCGTCVQNLLVGYHNMLFNKM